MRKHLLCARLISLGSAVMVARRISDTCQAGLPAVCNHTTAQRNFIFAMIPKLMPTSVGVMRGRKGVGNGAGLNSSWVWPAHPSGRSAPDNSKQHRTFSIFSHLKQSKDCPAPAGCRERMSPSQQLSYSRDINLWSVLYLPGIAGDLPPFCPGA